jgi:hypothetical protein
MGMGVSVVVIVVVGMSLGHGQLLYYNITGVHVWAAAPLRSGIPGWSEGPDPESRDSGFDASHRPEMTWMQLRVLAAHTARGLQLRWRPLVREGAGKAGCALHPRSRVPNAQKKTHTSIQVQRRHPAFPAQWLYGLLRALPGERLSCHRRSTGCPVKLDASTAASEPHDFAVRERPASSVMAIASTASHRAFVTIASAPLAGWDGA